MLENNKGTVTSAFLHVLMLLKFGLTYDDVLLVPKRSSLISRKLVDTKTYLTPKIQLQIPLISANMDTVTESAMAIAMAKLGGIGIIHRFLSIENQVKEVEKVKKQGNLLVGAAVGVKNGFLERTQALRLMREQTLLWLISLMAIRIMPYRRLLILRKNFPKLI